MDWDTLIRSELAPMVPYAPGLRASEVRERSGRSVIRNPAPYSRPRHQVRRRARAASRGRGFTALFQLHFTR